MIVFYLLVTFFATALGSFTGMGGGVVIKPVLDLLGHYDVASVSMLSSVTVFAMAAVGLLMQRKMPEKPDAKTAVPLGVGALLGGNAGALLLNGFITGSGVSGRVVSLTQNALLALVVGGIFVYMQKKDSIPARHFTGVLPCALAGLALGVVASFLGIGGGPLNVALIMWLFSFSARKAAYCSLLAILLSQAAKLAGTAVAGGFAAYDLTMLPTMLAGGVAGGVAGGALAARVGGALTEKLFSAAQALIFVLCVVNIIRFL